MFELMPFDQRPNNLSNLFDIFEQPFFRNFSSGMTEIRTDIRDTGDAYLLEAELPGFQKEEIKLDLNGDVLTISAQHQEQEEKSEEKGYVRRERRYGAFSRSFDVSGINTDAITASYQNGVLELKLPKKMPQQPASRQIELH